MYLSHLIVSVIFYAYFDPVLILGPLSPIFTSIPEYTHYSYYKYANIIYSSLEIKC